MKVIFTLVFLQLVLLSLSSLSVEGSYRNYPKNSEDSINNTPKVKNLWTNTCDECQIVNFKKLNLLNTLNTNVFFTV